MELMRIDKHSCADVALVGGKCAGLIRLLQLDMNVPEALVLTTAAYERQAGQWGLNDKIFPLIEQQGLERSGTGRRRCP